MPKIHLIRTTGPGNNYSVEPELVNRVAGIINETEGYLRCEAGPVDHLYPNQTKEHQVRDFNEAKTKLRPLNLLNWKSSYKFPRTESRASWKTLFQICERFRERNNISNEDYVFVLTDVPNEFNWFVALDNTSKDPWIRNGFIHTSDWEWYTKSSSEFPISYLIITSVLKFQLANSWKGLQEYYHPEAKGCIMDLCKNKEEISIKLRTADICSSCLKGLQERNIEPLLLDQAKRIMERVRSEVKNINRIDITPSPVPLKIVVDKEKCDIILEWQNPIKLKFRPVEKVIYLLHLLHEPGYLRTEFFELKEKFSSLYIQFHYSESQTRTLDDLFDRTKPGNMSTAFSTTKRAVLEQIPPPILDYYELADGEQKNSKLIRIPREFVKGLDKLREIVENKQHH